MSQVHVDIWSSHRLLQPWQHFVPVTPMTLGEAVKDCLANDADCKRIGEHGKQLVSCELALPVQHMYLERVLRLLKEVQVEEGVLVRSN